MSTDNVIQQSFTDREFIRQILPFVDRPDECRFNLAWKIPTTCSTAEEYCRNPNGVIAKEMPMYHKEFMSLWDPEEYDREERWQRCYEFLLTKDGDVKRGNDVYFDWDEKREGCRLKFNVFLGHYFVGRQYYISENFTITHASSVRSEAPTLEDILLAALRHEIGMFSTFVDSPLRNYVFIWGPQECKIYHVETSHCLILRAIQKYMASLEKQGFQGETFRWRYSNGEPTYAIDVDGVPDHYWNALNWITTTDDS